MMAQGMAQELAQRAPQQVPQSLWPNGVPSSVAPAFDADGPTGAAMRSATTATSTKPSGNSGASASKP